MSEILTEAFVPGRARPKGSLRCRGGRLHTMEEDNPESKPWRIKMAGALRADRDTRFMAFPGPAVGTWHGAVDVSIIAFYDVASEAAELLGAPIRKEDAGDTDKISRNVLDALQDASAHSPAVLADDSQVIGLFAEEVFTYSRGEQGIWIRVTTVEAAELVRRRRLRNAALEQLRARLGLIGATGF